MSAVSRGYRTISERFVKINHVTVQVEGGPSYDDPRYLEDWTYYQGLRVSVALSVDLPGARHATGDAAGVLGVSIAWACKRTGLRGTSEATPIADQNLTTSVEIPAGTLRGQVQISPRIILLQPGPTRDKGSPDSRGSLLWQLSDPIVVRLEGVAARMPIMTAPVRGEPFLGQQRAKWKIEVDRSDLDVPVEAAIRVILNEGNDEARLLLEDPHREAARAIEHFLTLDVHRELVRAALHEDTGLDPSRTYPDDSIGALLQLELSLLSEPIDTLRLLRDDYPARLDTDIQGRLGTTLELP